MESVELDLSQAELENVLHFSGAIGKEEVEFQIADRVKRPPRAKYVLFDQCGSEKVVVVHSDGVSPRPYEVLPDPLVHDHNTTGSQTLQALLSSAGLQDQTCDLQVYKNAMAAALLEFESSHSGEERLELFDSMEQPLQANSGSWQENTDDLDALMESDEEEVSELNSASVTSDLTREDHSGGVELSGYLSSEGETDGKGRSSRRSRDCRLSVRSTRSSKKSRRQTIKYKIQVLRNIIPGGAGMEAASVLEETIRYITSLESMVRSTSSKP
ncbi:uncharacterized protein LOC9656006 isoform X2 [Selaginella moellendorffii]|uniref:uncharacterized protein LOC9656006 isoform X2 n=1 Tax=Selaginella moellendorffii TaxID=88036 RepID=UPI000D1C5B2F|nr:uncharacterized protein LOC9656006 isoform X2 [Selaginella moellendorffii]|eukprot:XP_024534711.1 uncharacterized protein LOC9656006 isoform X2 [Selaginella moellendorffii]